MTAAAILRGRALFKSYFRGPEEIHALSGVDLAIHPGEVVALVGPSGSGKTTLLNVLAGWEIPDTGELEWLGVSRDMHARPLPWSELAIVPQSLGLMPELSVRENVELAARLAGDSGAAARASELLDELGLAHLADRPPAETSLGEQQRAALARGVLLRPKLLMADEPTGHQDVVWTRGVLRALRSAAESGVACLMATHHRATVRFADRILAIRDGEVESVDELSLALPSDDL